MKNLLLFLAVVFFALSGFSENYTRTEDVIYRRKFGTALTMDVFQPEKPNGFGIVFVVSGGWFSSKEAIAPVMYKAFLDRGYTVFAVVHGSQPKFQIPEIIEDMHRAVRFIRYNATKYKIDPSHIGVTGGSAGGHLSLILATQGRKGSPEAKDPTDRESSAVQCVACFFPPTDFLNYGRTNESALGDNVLGSFKPAFGKIPADPEQRAKFGRDISPIYSVSTNLPPVLIIHGDADKLVPIQQAETFVERAKTIGSNAKLIVKKGGGHGWANWTGDFKSFVDWFDEHLRGIKSEQGAN